MCMCTTTVICHYIAIHVLSFNISSNVSGNRLLNPKCGHTSTLDLYGSHHDMLFHQMSASRSSIIT